jgi:hypothetical protein
LFQLRDKVSVSHSNLQETTQLEEILEVSSLGLLAPQLLELDEEELLELDEELLVLDVVGDGDTLTFISLLYTIIQFQSSFLFIHHAL